MNIDISSVSHHGACSIPDSCSISFFDPHVSTSSLPLMSVGAQYSPGFSTSFGTAPYSKLSWSRSDAPAACSTGALALPSSPEAFSCHAKTATLIAISATVRIGKRIVGMLSLSGIKGRQA
jgi:hypothetical protein